MEFGLTEQQIREGLAEELIRAMRSEGDAPTVHAVAHSIARILEQDHLRMAEQRRQAGVEVPASSRHGEAGGGRSRLAAGPPPVPPDVESIV